MIAVYDPKGRLLETLFHGRTDSGTHEIAFHAGRYTSGVYLYRLETGRFQQTCRLIAAG
jgi:hypothetical protein